jgi:hypothetical protein
MAWDLTGNAGTNPANNFVGTTDKQPLVIKTNGVEALRIDTGQNVGIGTTAPGARLTVDVANEGSLALRLMSGPNAFLDVTPTNAGGRFQTVLNTVNNRDLAILTGTGNLGIGTPSPGVRTHLEGTSDPEATLAIRRSDNNKFVRLGAGSIGVALDFDPTSVLVIQKNTSGVGGHLNGPELLRITPDGQVGIGTANPQAQLDVGGVCTVSTDIDITGRPLANLEVQGGQITVRANTTDTDFRSVTLGINAAGGFVRLTDADPRSGEGVFGWVWSCTPGG